MSTSEADRQVLSLLALLVQKYKYRRAARSHAGRLDRGARAAEPAPFTCFTSTKVHILTQKSLHLGAREVREGQNQILLAVLVQKYKY